jgi:hypothetical protein
MQLAIDMPVAGPASLDIVDVAGRRVARLLEGGLRPGRHTIEWDRRTAKGDWCKAGIYFVQFRAGGTQMTKTIVLVN